MCEVLSMVLDTSWTLRYLVRSVAEQHSAPTPWSLVLEGNEWKRNTILGKAE